MYLSKNIRYLRKKRGLSQEQVANAFGYDNYTTIQKWESEKSDPPVKVVKGLAELFGVNIDDLVRKDLETEPPTPAPTPDLTGQEASLIGDFRALNDTGKAEAQKRVHELTMIEDYTQEGEAKKDGPASA